MIIVSGISKSFNQVKALNNITLKIDQGILFGLIGPDGAGKTTLLRIITTLMIPDEGSVSVSGYGTVKDYRKIRQFVGYMPGRFSLYPDLTVKENLTFYATLFGTTVEENYEKIRPVYLLLEPFENRLARDLSGGMKQKLALSCALIHNPRILVLDEPTTGVDAVSRKEFWDTLSELKNTGMTILVSTPYMDEAARCDQIALIQNGNIVDQNTPSAILASYRFPLFSIRSALRAQAVQILRDIKGVRQAYLFGHSIHASLNKGLDADWLAREMSQNGIEDFTIENIEPGFEDCFIEAVQTARL